MNVVVVGIVSEDLTKMNHFSKQKQCGSSFLMNNVECVTYHFSWRGLVWPINEHCYFPVFL